MFSLKEIYHRQHTQWQQFYDQKTLLIERLKDSGKILLRRLLSRLYGIWTIFNFTWLMLLTAPFIILPIIVDEKRGGRIAFFFLRIWGFTFSALSLVFYKVKGREQLAKNQGYIFTANHGSYLDSPALVLAIPQQSRPLGKKEILSYPIFGFIFRYIGVTVDRSSLRSKQRSIERIKELIAKGIHIMIFPEGTMNTTPQLLRPFQDGAFRIAIETQTPVVPMAIINSRHLLPRDGWNLKPGTITVEFAAPIATTGMSMTDLPALRERVYQQIRQMLEQAE